MIVDTIVGIIFGSVILIVVFSLLYYLFFGERVPEEGPSPGSFYGGQTYTPPPRRPPKIVTPPSGVFPPPKGGIMKDNAVFFVIAVGAFLLAIPPYHAGVMPLCIIFVSVAVVCFVCGFIPWDDVEVNYSPLWFVGGNAVVWLIPIILAKEHFLKFLIAFLITGALGGIFLSGASLGSLFKVLGNFFSGIAESVRGLFDGLGDLGGSRGGGTGGWQTGGGTSYHHGYTSPVPNIAYHGTSKEAAYQILRTRLYKVGARSPSGLWLTTHISSAMSYAQRNGGFNGLVVEFALNFSSNQVIDSNQVLQTPTNNIIIQGYRAVKQEPDVFIILAEMTTGVNEYVKLDGVRPIRLLDQEGNQVA